MNGIDTNGLIAAYNQTGSIRGSARRLGVSFGRAKRTLADAGRLEPRRSLDDRLSAIEQKLMELASGVHLPQANDASACEPATSQEPKHPFLRSEHLVFTSRVGYSRIAWLSDIHFPYEDKKAVDVSLAFLEDWKPDLVILGGDTFDSYSINRYQKSPEQLNHFLQREFDLAQPTIKRVEGLGADVEIMLGNHEDRLCDLIANNPGLAGLRALEWNRLAELPARWQVIPNQARLRVGPLDFHHGDIKGRGQGAKHLAHWFYGIMKRSTVFGHYHRDDKWTERDGLGVLRGAFASGHLCNVQEAAEYCPVNNWTTGFITVHMDHSEELFEVRQHLIHDGVAVIDGKKYRG